jgi:hypothetical protein
MYPKVNPFNLLYSIYFKVRNKKSRSSNMYVDKKHRGPVFPSFLDTELSRQLCGWNAEWLEFCRDYLSCSKSEITEEDGGSMAPLSNTVPDHVYK